MANVVFGNNDRLKEKHELEIRDVLLLSRLVIAYHTVEIDDLHIEQTRLNKLGETLSKIMATAELSLTD